MKSKKIAVFGCSWTEGLEEHNFNNWVSEWVENYLKVKGIL